MSTITNARDYLEQVVKEDFKDFIADTSDLRKAIHSANSLYHLHEHVYAEHGNSTGSNSPGDFSQSLQSNCSEFSLVRDVTNATKHVSIDRYNADMTNADQISSRSTGWGELGFGEGTWGGTEQVIVELDDGSLRAFSDVAKTVLDMWENLFQSKGW